jgi:hypothetical protein
MLWAVNIDGPGDIFPARSREDAIALATAFNAWWLKEMSPHLRDHDPVLWASPVQWPYSAELHAANVMGEYGWLRTALESVRETA